MSQSKCSSNSAYYINIHILEARFTLVGKEMGGGGEGVRLGGYVGERISCLSPGFNICDLSPFSLSGPQYL